MAIATHKPLYMLRRRSCFSPTSVMCVRNSPACRSASVVFVVDSSEPDGTGSYAVLPSILLKMYDDRVIVF